MKKLIILSLLALISTGLSAQSFGEGNHGINVGIGFGNAYYSGSRYTSSLPVISGSYEYGIVEVPMGSELNGVVTVGGMLAFTGGKYDWWAGDDYYAWRSIMLAARGNYHFIFHDKFDPYAGLLLGFSFFNYTWKGDGSDPDWGASHGYFEFGIYAGARWFFNDRIAIYSELGYLPAYFNVGVTFKL